MARKLDNWLKGYRDFTEGTESPPVFHLWVALSTIAGAAQRKIWLDLGHFNVYTNMYIILVSEPGVGRKSTALRIGKNTLKGIRDYGQDVHFSTQATSIAAIIKQMAAIPNKDHQSITSFSSELGSLLGMGEEKVTNFLTDIYDCNPDWDKQTISRGLEKISRPWFSLMGATTPKWMGDSLSEAAVEGGFVARSIFVFTDEMIRVALPELSEEQKQIGRDLQHDLAEIAQIEGEFRLSDNAEEFYVDWYEDPSRDARSVDYRLQGFVRREHIHVLKVAMALSLAESGKMTLERRDIESAITLLEELKPGMKRVFSSVGKNVYSTDLDRIKHQIQKSGGIQYRELLAANIHAVEKDQLDKLLSSLVDMGDIERNGRGFIPAKEESQ